MSESIYKPIGFRKFVILGQVKSSLEISEDEYNNTMKTNLIGSWLVSKYVGTRMRSAGHGGSIINISSLSGLGRVEWDNGVAYTSSKAGLNYLTKVHFFNSINAK